MPPRMAGLAVSSLLALSGSACRGPAGPELLDDVLAQRAIWTAQAITNYSYDYEITGFFINTANQPIRLEVRQGVVQSATFVATGQPVPQGPTEHGLGRPARRQRLGPRQRFAAIALRQKPGLDPPVGDEPYQRHEHVNPIRDPLIDESHGMATA